MSLRRREFVRDTGARIAGCGLLALGGCGTGDGERAGADAGRDWLSRVSGLEEAVGRLLRQTATPAASVALIRDAKVVWARGFGVRDATSGEAAEESTIFEAASMSKPVFAYAVMKLCEQGVLTLDTPLIEYTPESFLPGDPRLGLITARHILSHTAGFQDARSGANPLRIHFRPGEKWMYSGEGYAYLQSAVTRLAGRRNAGDCERFEAGLQVCATDFDGFMRARLLDPFGMDHSGYLWRDAFLGRLARPHGAQGDALPYREPTAPGVARYGAMGGLLTTARDFANFLVEVIDPRPADPFRLSEGSLREMLRPQVKVEDGKGYPVSWALGWRIAHTAAGDLIGHGGDQMGFHSLSEASVAGKSGFVILTNGENGWKLIRELGPAISGLVHSRTQGE